MTIAFRTPGAHEAGIVRALFADSFTAAFGPLYRPEDLAAFLDEKNEAWFACQLADPDFAFRLAELDGRPAGFVKLGPDELEGPIPAGAWELHQLYLAPSAHGRGIGDALIGWGLGEAKARGFSCVRLSVYVDNHRARRLYERHGFREVRRTTFRVGTHIDEERLMQVDL